MPITDLPTLDLAARFGAYPSHDAAWVPGQPLAVNRDFDFALAMTMDGIGAGLAAKKRQDENLELARRLARVAPLELQELLGLLCAAAPTTRCQPLAGQSVRIYGLLFGSEDARLQIALELQPNAHGPMLFSAIAELRSCDDLLERGALQAAYEAAMPEIAFAIDNRDSSPGNSGKCRLGNGVMLEGRILGSNATHTLLRVQQEAPHWLMCPSGALEAARSKRPSDASPSDAWSATLSGAPRITR